MALETVRLRCAPLGTGILLLLLIGCRGRSTAEQALNQAIRESGGTRLDVARFAGTVIVDGQPPSTANHQALIVMLYDPKNPPSEKNLLQRAYCDENGHFEFGTYTRDDGVPVGSYTVLFAQWTVADTRYRGTDGLKNLYNDPDKSEFQVEVTPPGKTDYKFELKTEGREENRAPGPRAISSLKN